MSFYIAIPIARIQALLRTASRETQSGNRVVTEWEANISLTEQHESPPMEWKCGLLPPTQPKYTKNEPKSKLLLVFLVYMQKNHYFEGTDLVRFAELAHLEITFAKCRPYSTSLAIFSKCGLRPRVEWRGSNFGRRLL